MKSPNRRRKSIIIKNNFNRGLFNSLEINKKINFNTDEDVNYKKYKSENKYKIISKKDINKNSQKHKRNSLLQKENLKFIYKMKNYVTTKINNYYNDKCNYNKLIINNILSNNNSKIRKDYIEMLYEIESKDLLSKYILKRDVYYFLKYLLVVYDKFHVQFPNYLKDINVYNFMNDYLLVKQKFIDRASKSNYQTYIEENIKKLYSRHPSQDSKFFQSKISHDTSDEENHMKKKQIRGQGFDLDDEDSQDSLEKLENLVTKMNTIPIKENSDTIFQRARSKSIKNTNSFLVKYFKIEKDKLVNWNSLYKKKDKNPMRGKIKRKTEIAWNRDKVNLEKINVKKENKKIKKKSKNKKKEIKEIKKLFLLNDFGKKNKVLMVKKKGFLFITERNRNNNKNYFKSKNKTQNIKLDKIKEKYKTLNKSEKFYNYNKNEYNKKNYLMKKNIKNIVRNLNSCLNEYHFNNKIKYNLSEKQRYYNNRITSGIFNNKANLLLNLRSVNIKNTQTDKNSKFPTLLLETKSSSLKKYNTIEQKPCKKLNKNNNNFYRKKLIKHNLWLSIYNLKRENNNYIHNIITYKDDEENPREINNQIERLESSIYNFFKTNRMKNKSLFKYEINNSNYINKISMKNSNNKIYMKTEPSLGFADDSKFRHHTSKEKNFLLRNSNIIFNNNYKGENYKIKKYDNISMSDKNIKKETSQNIVYNGKSDKSTLKNCFSDIIKGKKKKILFKVS